MKVNKPSVWTIILSIVVAVLEYLNQKTFSLPGAWAYLVTYGLMFIAAIAWSPLVGGAFRNALHLSAQVSVAVTAVVTTATAAVVHIHDGTLRGLVVAALAVAAGLGFGPASAVVLAKLKEA